MTDAKVFYIAADGTIMLAAADLHNANGLAVSKDGGTLYVVETEENRLLQFRIGPNFFPDDYSSAPSNLNYAEIRLEIALSQLNASQDSQVGHGRGE